MPIANFKPAVNSNKKDCGCAGGVAAGSLGCRKDKSAGCGCGCGGEKKCCGSVCCGGHMFVKKLKIVLLFILLVYLIFFVGTLVRNNIKKYHYIGKADSMERTLSVNGFGKVSGNNDIAVTTIGYSNTNKDVAKAQAENKKVMDKIMDELKKLNIAEKDLQTNYTIYPDYNYNQQEGQKLIGYRVSNNVTVKIRDLSKIPEILGLAGKYGATEVGGLSFTIDDPENLKADARAKALSDVKAKARLLADKLGVKLGNMVSYNEYEGGSDYYPTMKAYGIGGAEAGGGPETVAAGSKDVTMNVNITYEILSK